MGSQSDERLDWLLGAIAEPDELTVADLEPRYDMSQWRGWSLEDELRMLKGEGQIKRPFTVTSRSEADGAAIAVVHDVEEKDWQVTVWAEPDPPFRISGLRVVPAPPEGLTVRDATSEEAVDLTELERRSPIKLGDTLMYFDRGDDYFAAARLMGEVTVYVAEPDDGGIAGVYWGAQQHVLVSGEPKVLFLENRVRIDPESRRGGVFWALCVYGRDRYARTSDSIAFYVSPDNEGVQKFVRGTPKWTVQPERVLVPCTGDAPVPRRATKDDAADIVRILNAAHDGEALYVPYTVESLTERLSRDPGQYSWSDLRVNDGAVVGIGQQTVEVTKVTGEQRVGTNRAVVLDHGGVDDDAYRALLRATACELAADGVSHLAAFTSEGSSTLDVLTELGTGREPYDFWAFNIECPADLPTTGFYVDPVYF